MKIFLLARSLGRLCGEGPFELELYDLCLGRAEEKPKNKKVNKISVLVARELCIIVPLATVNAVNSWITSGGLAQEDL